MLAMAQMMAGSNYPATQETRQQRHSPMIFTSTRFRRRPSNSP
jgi:hypothetical protein